MVKKLALTSLFYNNTTNKDISTNTSSPPTCPTNSMSITSSSNYTTSWQWPSCKNPRTISFREHHDLKSCYKTMNSAYNSCFLDSADDSCFSRSFATSADVSDSMSTASAASAVAEGKETEAVIHGVKSDRLFFEPESTSSIVKTAKQPVAMEFDGALAMAVDSEDPYGDFRSSMEEMVMTHGVADWGWLADMLGWYLRANGKKTHELIIGAFVDLLVGLSSPSAC